MQDDSLIRSRPFRQKKYTTITGLATTVRAGDLCDNGTEEVRLRGSRQRSQRTQYLAWQLNFSC